jgi:hypothetical protein
MNYNIYAGLAGGFGDADYCGTGDFNSLEEAEDRAYQEAWACYESYEGVGGILSWADVADREGYDMESDAAAINIAYNEEVESWLDYYAVPTEEDDLPLNELYDI